MTSMYTLEGQTERTDTSGALFFSCGGGVNYVGLLYLTIHNIWVNNIGSLPFALCGLMSAADVYIYLPRCHVRCSLKYCGGWYLYGTSDRTTFPGDSQALAFSGVRFDVESAGSVVFRAAAAGTEFSGIVGLVSVVS